MRHIVLHYHIFKNGGTTIDSILKNNFGDAVAQIEGIKPWGTLDATYIFRYALDHPTVKVISSHQARPPVPASPDITFHPIVLLRHPIDRVSSVYAFERKQPIQGLGPGIAVAHENPIDKYVKWRLCDGNGAVIKNFQTIFLSGRETDMMVATATPLDLEIALKRIQTLPMLGIVEFFQDSVLKMKHYLSKLFDDFDISYVIQNMRVERKNLVEERIEELRSDLGPGLFNELLDKNALDMELYSKALELFNREGSGHRL